MKAAASKPPKPKAMVVKKTMLAALGLGTSEAASIGVAAPKRAKHTAPITRSSAIEIQLPKPPAFCSCLPKRRPRRFKARARARARSEAVMKYAGEVAPVLPVGSTTNRALPAAK